MKKINATITENQYKLLSSEAERRGVSVSEILRRALDYWIDTKVSIESGHAGTEKETAVGLAIE